MITKNELYELYINKNLSSIKISKLKKISKTTVLNYLTKYNIIKKSSGSQIKYRAIDNYFDKWSNNMAYCLGFIASDGHVWKDRPYFTIGINKKDISVLNFIKDCISPTSKIRISKNKCQLCVYSKQIYKRLNYLGINHNKTFNLQLPKNIPNKYISHFMRGFFDGDGSIWKTQFRKNGKDYYYANIISASKKILSGFQKYLRFGNLRKIKNKYYELSFSQTNCLKLFTILYKDAEFKLDRKYDKFLLIDTKYKLWSKLEDEKIVSCLQQRDTKQLISILPDRSPKAIQARKNYLRKIHTNVSSKNN
jgi:hypothetical protein